MLSCRRLAALASALFLLGVPFVSAERRPDSDFARAIDRCIRGKDKLDLVRIDLMWDHERAQAFGSGAVIWDHAAACPASRDEIVQLLKRVNEAGFGSMPTRIGEGDENEENEKPGRRVEESPLKGILTIEVGPRVKTVLQMRGGPQSKPFEELATRILAAGKPCDATGVRAANLKDGLASIASGKLAPETLRILAQRKHKAAPGAESGWMLQAVGPQLIGRVLRQDAPAEKARWLMLSPKEFSDVLELLRASDPGALPQNLFAPEYTDLRVRILTANRAINARQFSGMTPTTRGAQQQTFDRLYERFVQLFRQVQEKGVPLLEELPARDRKTEEESEEKGGEKKKTEAPRD